MSSFSQVSNDHKHNRKTKLTAIKGNKKVSSSCPTSAEKVSEAGVRIIATITGLLIMFSLFVLQPYKAANLALLGFLTFDFAARGFGYKKFSLLARIAGGIVSIFKIKTKSVNAGPKIFASKIGFLCSLMTGIFFALGLNIAAMVIAGIFLFCAMLESLFSFCLGCKIYGFIHRTKVYVVKDTSTTE